MFCNDNIGVQCGNYVGDSQIIIEWGGCRYFLKEKCVIVLVEVCMDVL